MTPPNDGDELPPPSTPLEIRLTREVLLLRETVAALEAQVAKLLEKLGRYSGNSNQPPSKDEPGDPPRKKPSGSGRRPGGQPGHRRHKRELVPVDKVDDIRSILPTACRQCGGENLSASDLDPIRRQVWDLPADIRARVTEYQIHALFCPDCRLDTRARPPAGLPSGDFGPRIQGWIAYLSGDQKLADRKVQELLLYAFGLEISLGAIANLRRSMSTVLEAPVEAAHQYVQRQPVVHADETSWREGTTKSWLWVAVTPMVAVFLIRASRSAEVARELLGTYFTGTLVSDRLKSYDWVWNWQSCWAHLLRAFAKIAGRPGKPGRLGRKLEKLGSEVFEVWHRYQAGDIARATLHKHIRAKRKAMATQLRAGVACGHADTAGECRDALSDEPWMWTFAYVDGVDPTNNLAERAVRPGVIWRKIRSGTQSAWGSRFVERILTVTATLKQQGRNVLHFLIEASEAGLAGSATPSLLPAH